MAERCLLLWKNEKLDLSLQKACMCDRALFRSKSPKIDEEGIVWVLTKLIQHGKVKTALQRSRGCVLNPNGIIDGRNTVFEVL